MKSMKETKEGRTIMMYMEYGCCCCKERRNMLCGRMC